MRPHEIVIRPAFVLLLAALAACAPARPAPPPPAPPPSVRTTAAPPPAPAPVRLDSVRTCAVKGGELVEVAAVINWATTDTLVDGKPFSNVHPLTAEYAGVAEWFVNNEPFDYRDEICLLKYGLPRTLRPAEVKRASAHRGVPMFIEADDDVRRPDVVYLPVTPGCWFQAYQWELVIRPCRGSFR